MTSKHIPVILDGVLKNLEINPEGIYVDLTLGLGGHTREILKHLKGGKVIGFDKDKKSLAKAQENLKDFSNVIYVHSDFKDILNQLDILGVDKVDAILIDLGTSYYQLTDKERGFTYQRETLLDMRLNQEQVVSAITVINTYPEEELITIFRDYGEEPSAKRLAAEIVRVREEKEITTSDQLNEIIWKIKGHHKKNPLKNIYQAIRIETNDEFGSLKQCLSDCLKKIKEDGNLLVITFHSLEDKIVKDFFFKKKLEIIETPFERINKFKTKKTIYPSKEEIEQNNASRSAKLRTLKICKQDY